MNVARVEAALAVIGKPTSAQSGASLEPAAAINFWGGLRSASYLADDSTWPELGT